MNNRRTFLFQVCLLLLALSSPLSAQTKERVNVNALISTNERRLVTIDANATLYAPITIDNKEGSLYILSRGGKTELQNVQIAISGGGRVFVGGNVTLRSCAIRAETNVDIVIYGSDPNARITLEGVTITDGIISGAFSLKGPYRIANDLATQEDVERLKEKNREENAEHIEETRAAYRKAITEFDAFFHRAAQSGVVITIVAGETAYKSEETPPYSFDNQTLFFGSRNAPFYALTFSDEHVFKIENDAVTLPEAPSGTAEIQFTEHPVFAKEFLDALARLNRSATEYATALSKRGQFE